MATIVAVSKWYGFLVTGFPVTARKPRGMSACDRAKGTRGDPGELRADLKTAADILKAARTSTRDAKFKEYLRPIKASEAKRKGCSNALMCLVGWDFSVMNK